MSVDTLTPSMQNYLKVIWGLQEWNDAPVSNSAIAESAGVRLSTVSDALRKLAEQGLVGHARYGDVSLTEEGREYAISMTRRHRLLETYLVRHLGYQWDEVHDEADRLEHAVSDELVDRIDHALGYPTRDPHGDPIPTRDGEVRRPDAVPLGEVPAPRRVRIERISDADNEMLQYFASRGLVVDAVLDIGESAPYSETVEVTVAEASDQGAGSSAGSEPVTLGASAAGAIWVAPVAERDTV